MVAYKDARNQAHFSRGYGALALCTGKGSRKGSGKGSGKGSILTLFIPMPCYAMPCHDLIGSDRIGSDRIGSDLI